MSRYCIFSTLAVIALATACGSRDDVLDLAQYESDNLAWRAARLERL
jgi:hypothetical protein